MSGPTSKAPFLIPDRITVAAALQEALEGNYQSVHVSLEPCPDLRTCGKEGKRRGEERRGEERYSVCYVLCVVCYVVCGVWCVVCGV